MRCRSCGHHFDWISKRSLRLHNSHNKFEDEDITERLPHYVTRYTNHIKSLKIERRLYDSVVSKMPFLTSETVTDATSSADTIVILKQAVAVRTLRRSRQVLISTSVFAYYSEHCNQLVIFESNQSDLERATEGLSWILELGISTKRWSDLIEEVEEKYMYCDKRWRVLLDHINEGYENEYWNLRDD